MIFLAKGLEKYGERINDDGSRAQTQSLRCRGHNPPAIKNSSALICQVVARNSDCRFSCDTVAASPLSGGARSVRLCAHVRLQPKLSQTSGTAASQVLVNAAVQTVGVTPSNRLIRRYFLRRIELSGNNRSKPGQSSVSADLT